MPRALWRSATCARVCGAETLLIQGAARRRQDASGGWARHEGRRAGLLGPPLPLRRVAQPATQRRRARSEVSPPSGP